MKFLMALLLCFTTSAQAHTFVVVLTREHRTFVAECPTYSTTWVGPAGPGTLTAKCDFEFQTTLPSPGPAGDTWTLTINGIVHVGCELDAWENGILLTDGTLHVFGQFTCRR